MCAYGVSLNVDHLPETAGSHISTYERIQFGKDIGEPGPLHDLCGDGGQQRLRHWQGPSGEVSLVHLGFRGGELHL